jgi:molecular chaperone DnaJ
MTDPYQILGVSRGASDDVIKKAYRELSRRYHPDANINNPYKADAEERFKEIQQAYQQIMKEKEQGSSYAGFGGFGSQSYSDYSSKNDSSMLLGAAANYVRNGYYTEALNVLSGMNDRDATWYYLSAIANNGLRNNVTALEHARIAVRMNPGNIEYQQLVQALESGGMRYTNTRSAYGAPSMFGNDMCFKLCIANLLCNICCSSGDGGLCYGGGMPLGS